MAGCRAVHGTRRAQQRVERHRRANVVSVRQGFPHGTNHLKQVQGGLIAGLLDVDAIQGFVPREVDDARRTGQTCVGVARLAGN